MHSSYDTLQSSHQCTNMQVGSPHFMLIRIWEYLLSWDTWKITHPWGIPPVSINLLEVCDPGPINLKWTWTFYNSQHCQHEHTLPVSFPDYLQTISLGMRLVSVRCRHSLVPRPFPPSVFAVCKKGRRKAWERDEESWGPSCNILSKTLRLKHLKDVNNACYLVDPRLINARFVSSDDRLATTPLTSTLMTTWCHAHDS